MHTYNQKLSVKFRLLAVILAAVANTIKPATLKHSYTLTGPII